VVQAFDPKACIPGLPGWEAIHTPGHTPGHFSLYRRSDRVLITGDAVVSINLNSLLGVLFGRRGVFGPPRYSTWDLAAAQRSIMILAALEPLVVATGHGEARVDEAARSLHGLAQGQDRPARWRQGFFTGVDTATGSAIDHRHLSTSGYRSDLVRSWSVAGSDRKMWWCSRCLGGVRG
jgi:glyoxylase-like metal-dependent hydrolase (beta-lactamase superfamily II)